MSIENIVSAPQRYSNDWGSLTPNPHGEWMKYADYDRLRAAAYQACSDMGCFCPDGENGICPMCQLEKVLHG